MLPRSGEVIALTVSGDSMIEEGIHDGDTLFVQRTDSVRDGTIAVVLVEDETTVKFFFREGDRIRLQPAHPTMEPIYVSATSGDVRVLGRAVGVWRQL